MTGNIEKSAIILSVGMIAAAIIAAVALTANTSKLSASLVKAGSNARSHHSTSFPSELRIQTTQKANSLTMERKKELQDAFIKACLGKEFESKKIIAVKIEKFEAKYWGDMIEVAAKVTFDDDSVYDRNKAYLHCDGFGGYTGFLRGEINRKLIVPEIYIK